MPLFLVNVIPATLSDDTRQDSECSVAVNPVDPRQVAVEDCALYNLRSARRALCFDHQARGPSLGNPRGCAMQ